MRITGGALVRRPLDAPKGNRTRPTTDRVREALFNVLGARLDLDGARVLDVFAGSGALGLEALSRGAASSTFVEQHGPTLAVARRNAASLGVSTQTTFQRADALATLRRDEGSFDLVLADPPYDLAALPGLPALMQARLTPGGLAVVEHDARHDFADAPGLVFARSYGRTVLSLFERL